MSSSIALEAEQENALSVQAKFSKILNEHAHWCLLQLLIHLVRGRDFIDDSGNLFHTSNYGGTALFEYLHGKKDVLKNITSHLNEQSRKLIYEDDGTIKKVIQISNFDISLLKLTLENICDFPTCFHKVKGSFRNTNACAKPQHAVHAKCCVVCDHEKTTKEARCKNTACKELKSICKDNSAICCSKCNMCYNCSRNLATPICPSHSIRHAIRVITATRNLCNHDSAKVWEDILRRSLPESFHDCGTWEDIWRKCVKAMESIMRYLNVDKDEFDKRIYKIGKIRFENNSDLSTGKGHVLVESQKLNITLRFTNRARRSFFFKLFKSGNSSHAAFKEYVNQSKGLDDELVHKVESTVTEILSSQLPPYVPSIKSYFDIKCSDVMTEQYKPTHHFELLVTIKPKHNSGCEILRSDYADRDTKKSEELFKKIQENLIHFAKDELKIHVNVLRFGWSFGSIKISLNLVKTNEIPWLSQEKQRLVRLAETISFPEYPNFDFSWKADASVWRRYNGLLELNFTGHTFGRNISKLLMEMNLRDMRTQIKVNVENFLDEEWHKQHQDIMKGRRVDLDIELSEFKIAETTESIHVAKNLGIQDSMVEEACKEHAVHIVSHSYCHLVSGMEVIDGFLIKFEADGSEINGVLTNQHLLYYNIVDDGSTFKIYLKHHHEHGKELEVSFTSETFRFTCPLLNTTFVQLEYSLVNQLKEIGGMFLTVNENYVRTNTGIYSMYLKDDLKSDVFECSEMAINSCWGFTILYDAPLNKAYIPKAALKLNHTIEAIYQRTEDSAKYVRALRVCLVSDAVCALNTFCSKHKGKKINRIPYSPAKQLSREEINELNQMGLQVTRNEYVFISPSSFMVTPLWFYRTNHAWYWTPTEPKTFSNDDLRDCNWIPIGTGKSMKVIGGPWQDLEPAKRNIMLINKLAESGFKYLVHNDLLEIKSY